MKTFTTIRINLALFALALVTMLAGAAVSVKLNSASAQEQAAQGRRVSPQPAQAESFTAAVEPSEEVIQLRRQMSNPAWLTQRTLHFDVTENAKRFVFDETPLHADGAPAYGNEFVTEGYIYVAGTLNGSDGVNPDGSPQYPNKVVGRWTCRGWHTGEGAKTVTGPWVVTHQLYDLGKKPGQTMLVTDGLELVDLNESIQRAISGGTGAFAQARGEMRQTMIGFNQLNGVNLRVEFKVQNR
jgi:hypothetical protein